MAPTCRIDLSRASAHSTIVGGPPPRDVSHGPYRLPRLIESSGISDLRASSCSRIFQTARARLEDRASIPVHALSGLSQHAARLPTRLSHSQPTLTAMRNDRALLCRRQEQASDLRSRPSDLWGDPRLALHPVPPSRLGGLDVLKDSKAFAQTPQQFRGVREACNCLIRGLCALEHQSGDGDHGYR